MEHPIILSAAEIQQNVIVKRIPIKPQPDKEHQYYGGEVTHSTDKKLLGCVGFMISPLARIDHDFRKPPYQPGQVVYVKETWNILSNSGIDTYEYAACFEENWMKSYWRPASTMPKAAARLWYKIISVKAVRLQDITEEEAIKSGITEFFFSDDLPDEVLERLSGKRFFNHAKKRRGQGVWGSAIRAYRELWNSTIKKQDRYKYGWDANPWIWEVTMERCEKPEVK